jgi:hypothetical protein
MTVVFPKNNLPEPAQPWAREVQKQLSNVIASDRSNEVNNAARDNQLNSSLISLTGVVSDVKVASDEASAAINGLIGLGSSGSSYTLNADNINAGTINASVIAVTNIDATNITTGKIVGGAGFATLDFESSNGGSSFQVWDNNARMTGGSAVIQCFDSTILLSGTVSALSTLNVSSSLTGSSSVFFPSLASTTNAANVRVGTAGGGQLFVVTSARKYKVDIQDIEVGLGALQLKPRTWIDKGEYERNGNSTNGLTRVPGFVAEEVLEAGLDEFILYDELGEIQGLSYDRMLASVIPVLQHHNNKIVELTERITTLENGA